MGKLRSQLLMVPLCFSTSVSALGIARSTIEVRKAPCRTQRTVACCLVLSNREREQCEGEGLGLKFVSSILNGRFCEISRGTIGELCLMTTFEVHEGSSFNESPFSDSLMDRGGNHLILRAIWKP